MPIRPEWTTHPDRTRAPGAWRADSPRTSRGSRHCKHHRIRNGFAHARDSLGRRAPTPAGRQPVHGVTDPASGGSWLVHRWSCSLVAGTLVVADRTPRAGPGRRGIGRPMSLASVQTLYAKDLVARVNAERAARNSPGQPVPPLVDGRRTRLRGPGLGRCTSPRPGSVQDPPLAACGSRPHGRPICVLAGNSGDSGTGFWPGDGSDGMESDYMASAGHRQNMLNAGYDTVGHRRDLQRRPGLDRRALRLRLRRPRPGPEPPGRPERRRGRPGAARDRRWPAPRPACPVYCPGQVVGPNGAVDGHRRAVSPTRMPVPAGPRRAGVPADRDPAVVGIAAAGGDRATGWPSPTAA